MDTRKIMLGSAQFGMRYGIANQAGQVHESEIAKILTLAEANQINMIDTASQYGDSEIILGKLTANPFNIITKLRPLVPGCDVADFVTDQCNLSLHNLNRSQLAGLLVHHAADLLSPQGKTLYQTLVDLKEVGKVKKIGVSVYSPEQAHELLDRYKIDLVQFPINLLDQRFLANNFLSTLKNKGISLHARSLFLQGVLLMENIPNHFAEIKPLLESFSQECKQIGITIRQGLIEFVATIKEIDHCIFGIDNHDQLQEIIHDFSHCASLSRINSDRYRCNDLNMINPMNWKTT